MQSHRAALTPSPFVSPDGRAPVFVSTGQGAYANIRAVLAHLDLSPAAGRTVLLKPNAGRMAKPGRGVTTHPQAVAAAIDAFQEAGASVLVGESPISGVDTQEAFAATGIAHVARARDCPLVDLDAGRPVRVAIADGVAVTEIQVCPRIFACDLLVSLPVMKMHMHTGVSLSIKNLKGCLWRRTKVTFHMLPPVAGCDDRSLDIAIVDLFSALRPHLALLDGAVAMEGLGPSAGRPRKMDTAVVSADPLAADTIAACLMGLDPRAVGHLRLAGQRGLGAGTLGAIDVHPADWETRIQPLAPPPADLSVAFPNVTIYDAASCSACQSTLLLFLKRYGDQIFDYFPGDTPLRFAIGRGNETVPAGTVCIGNCTAKHKAKGIFVPGCPPVASEILRTLSGEELTDTLDGEDRTDRDHGPPA